MTATIDEVANTLGEFEALAQSTGQWDGADPVEFSADGVTWLPVWIPTEAKQFPPFARATVRRKGVTLPTVMVVAWDESVPAAEEWRDLWQNKPMKLFGSFALRSAIRHAFRDVVGDRTGPDEDRTGPTVDTRDPWEARDWDAELAAAETVEALDGVWRDARTARSRTAPREVAYKARRQQMVVSENLAVVEAAIAKGRPGFIVDPRSSGRASRMQDFLDEQATETAPPAKPGRTPQDHKPAANRATRRANARKKGGKR